MSDTSGPTSRTPFASYDPDSSSWKTSGVISLWDSTAFSETWPSSGMTRGGYAFQLPLPAPLTVESASSSLPTLRASRGASATETMYLLFPTPAAGNPNDGEDTNGWLSRRERVKERVGNGNGMGMPLTIAVQLLPTPKASDGEKGGPNQRGSSGDLTISSAVHQLTGDDTKPRYAGGRTSSDGWPPPRQLPMEETDSSDSRPALWSG